MFLTLNGMFVFLGQWVFYIYNFYARKHGRNLDMFFWRGKRVDIL